MHRTHRLPSWLTVSAAAIAAVAVLVPAPPVAALAGQATLTAPAGSVSFGSQLVTLPNGNILVADSDWTTGGHSGLGAVHLFDGRTHTLISSITGSHDFDAIGAGSITVLPNSNYLIAAPDWDNGATVDAGAVVFGKADGSVSGVLSPSNSLVGSTANDGVGSVAPIVLTNGNYVVGTSGWDNGPADVGASTWGSGATGVVGPISSTNSLIGSRANSAVGSDVVALTNGNYVASTETWGSGGLDDLGAVTLGNGLTGTVGFVTSANSLVGGQTSDRVGTTVKALTNGNYVVASPDWANGGAASAGAVTWASGTVGITGLVTSANSLLGSTANDFVGIVLEPLTNGNYVTGSKLWDNGATADVGAIVWGSGTTGVTGVFGPAPTLHGTTAGDMVGSAGVAALTNGNYVVASPLWHNGAVASAGAATWGNGTSGTTGAVSAANSLVGSTANDGVGGGAFGGSHVTALASGNYVVYSPAWDNISVTDAGAVTWGNGTTGTAGAVTSSNSFVSNAVGDQVGSGGVVALTNGNYVIVSPVADMASVDSGAITWGNGTTGLVALLGLDNSIYGYDANEFLGDWPVVALTDGSYAVGSPDFTGGGTGIGAVERYSGTAASTGSLNNGLALYGARNGDQLGTDIDAVARGGFVSTHYYVDTNALHNAGAVTYSNSSGPIGAISSTNSIEGLVDSGGTGITTAFEPIRGTLYAGFPQANTVVYATVDPDTTAPTLTTVAALVRTAGAPTTITYTAPTATDDRSTATVSCDHPSGSTFAFGTTTVTCTATDASGNTASTSFTVTITSPLLPLTPARLLETRLGEQPTVDGLFSGLDQVNAGGTIELPVIGRGGVPVGTSSVALNVTVTEPATAGFVTVFPCGSPRPLASNLNYVAGQTIPNAVIAKVGTGGKVCLFSSARTHLVVDVDGAYVAGSGYTSTVPARLLETRPGEAATVDGQSFGAGVRPAGTVTELQVTGRAGVPADATSVALNVTVTEPTGSGFVTVYPCGTTRPLASNLNFVAGQTVPNLVIARIGAGGKVCIFNQAPTQLIADLNGFHTAVSSHRAIAPARLLETRTGEGPTIDGQSSGLGLLPAGTVTEVQITGRAGVPADAATAVLNVTVTEPRGAGFVTVYPCGATRPTASNLNHAIGQTIPNLVVAKIGTGGKVCIFNQTATQLIADLNGYDM